MSEQTGFIEFVSGVVFVRNFNFLVAKGVDSHYYFKRVGPGGPDVGTGTPNRGGWDRWDVDKAQVPGWLAKRVLAKKAPEPAVQAWSTQAQARFQSDFSVALTEAFAALQEASG